MQAVKRKEDGLEEAGEVVIPISNGDTVSTGAPTNLQYFAIQVCQHALLNVFALIISHM